MDLLSLISRVLPGVPVVNRPREATVPERDGAHNGERVVGTDGREYEWDALSDSWRRVPTPQEIAKSPAITHSSSLA